MREKFNKDRSVGEREDFIGVIGGSAKLLPSIVRGKVPSLKYVPRREICLIFLTLIIYFLVFSSPEVIFAREDENAGQISDNPRMKLDELDGILKALEKSDHGQGEGLPLPLERLVFQLKDVPELRLEVEKKLREFFVGSATVDALMVVSKPLSWLAGSETVKTLASLLLDPEKTEAVRYVLERVPGAEADRLLIESLGKAPSRVLPGIISSLGHRRVEAAIPEFKKILEKNKSILIVSTIIEALGNTGGAEAVKILSGYLKSGDEKLRILAADGLLRIASRDVERKNYFAAARISETIVEARVLPEMRMAAWKIKIITAGEKQTQELAAILRKSRDESALRAALMLLPGLVNREEIGSFIPLQAGLPENLQVQAVAVLAHYPMPEVREYLMKLVEKSLSVEVRTEALLSLGKTGDSSTVEFLVKKAASAGGKEKMAARESLVRLADRTVDKKILELLGQQPEQSLRNELLLAACERNIVGSRPFFLQEAANPAADFSLVARGLKAFGDISLAEELLPIAYKVEDENFRNELAGILASWARQSTHQGARSAYFRNLLRKESDISHQVLLISIIGEIGERSSLPLLREYLDNQIPELRSAALRAIAGWPEVEARDDLLKVARTSQDIKERVMAIRGLVRLTSSERFRLPQAVVETLKEIYELSPRAEEKRLVLSLFPDFPCPEGLAFCETISNDPEVGAEARKAIEKIKSRLRL